jgi:hypothetical protein
MDGLAKWTLEEQPMKNLHLDRVLRTASSERFMVRRDEAAIAALELHYLASGKVDGTLIVFEEAKVNAEQIPEMLQEIDRRLLPDVSVAEGNLLFTVVVGKVHGSFEPHTGP